MCALARTIAHHLVYVRVEASQCYLKYFGTATTLQHPGHRFQLFSKVGIGVTDGRVIACCKIFQHPVIIHIHAFFNKLHKIKEFLILRTRRQFDRLGFKTGGSPKACLQTGDIILNAYFVTVTVKQTWIRRTHMDSEWITVLAIGIACKVGENRCKVSPENAILQALIGVAIFSGKHGVFAGKMRIVGCRITYSGQYRQHSLVVKALKTGHGRVQSAKPIRWQGGIKRY